MADLSWSGSSGITQPEFSGCNATDKAINSIEREVRIGLICRRI